MQTPYGWCQTILNIFYVKLLLSKPTWIAHQIYIILSSHVASNFFINHGCRFVYARIKYFLSLAFYQCCIFQCLSQKKSKRLRVCLVHLLPLVHLVYLPRVARKIKVSSHGSSCFPCWCSLCSSIQQCHIRSIDSNKDSSNLSYLIISCGIQFFLTIMVVGLYMPESSISSP
jgi:hypothetical protein